MSMRPLFVRRSLWQRLSAGLPARLAGAAASIAAVGSLMVLWLSAR